MESNVKYYYRNPEYIYRNVAGEALLVPTGQAALDFNGMAVLNSTGDFLWNQLEKDKTLDELTVAFAAEYELTAEQARADLLEFLQIATERDLIRTR